MYHVSSEEEQHARLDEHETLGKLYKNVLHGDAKPEKLVESVKPSYKGPLVHLS